MSTPEPGLESEIEIAAEADTDKKDDDGENGSAQVAGAELLSSAAARLKLSTRPGKDMSLDRCAIT